MKHFVKLMVLSATSLILMACNTSDADNTTAADSNAASSRDTKPTKNQAVHSPSEKVTDWETALTYLKEGNQRFVSDTTM